MSDTSEDIKAQAMLIHDNPFQPTSIGDTNINWVSSDGDPTSVAGASFAGDASWADTDYGVQLTSATDGQTGYLYWQKNYNYTQNILMTATTRAGAGDGADGITLFMGCSDVTSGGADNGGIAVYLDEYNDDTIKLYKDGSLLATYHANKTLDDAQFNNWEFVLEHRDSDTILAHLKMNGNYIFRENVAPWTSNYDYIGIAGITGSQNNDHICKAFAVKTAKGWLAINQ